MSNQNSAAKTLPVAETSSSCNPALRTTPSPSPDPAPQASLAHDETPKANLPAATPESPPKIDDRDSIWDEAYQSLNPGLLEPYKALLDDVSEGSKDVQRTLAQLVNSNLEVMQAKQWKIKFRNKDIVVREKVEKIASALKMIMPVASAAASLDPVHAGLPIAGLGVLLDVSTQVIDSSAYIVCSLK
jgi:hypothetical protein